MTHLGPAQARELFDRLESEILHVPDALGEERERREGTDRTARVPGSLEPPD